MSIKMEYLDSNHPVIKAAILMADVYDKFDTMVPAIELVDTEIPGLTEDILISLWIGMNAMSNYRKASQH